MAKAIYLQFLLCFLLLGSLWALQCYQCNDGCTDPATCRCTNLVTNPTNDNYCTITRETVANGYNIYIRDVPRNVTPYYIYDPFYIAVEESVVYNPTTLSWTSISNKITYGCQKDKCNRADLVKQLPVDGLKLALSPSWLGRNLRRPWWSHRTYCHYCPDDIFCSDVEYFIDLGRCRVEECRYSCLISDVFPRAESEDFCYQSFCTDQVTDVTGLSAERIDITAVYYLKRKQLEIVQIAMTCNAEDCSELTLLRDVKEKLEYHVEGIRPFISENGATSSMATLSFLMICLSMFLFIQ